MTDSTILPGQRAALVDRNGTTTPEFYRFFRGLSVTAELPARVDDLSVRVAALEEGGGTIGDVVGQMSIVSAGILSNGLVTVRLAGDTAIAPALSFYGALTAGAKGWQTYSANFSALNNGDGTTSLDLADLANSGTGTALVKITRDAKGRVSGTHAATTTDLTEGSNLYYTDARSDARIAVAKADPNGVASLVGGKLDAGQLPALAITETFVVNTQAAMLALSAQEGDVAVRTDLSKSFILTAAPATTLANWQELLTPVSPVTSIFGRVGSVTAASGDYTFAQIGSKPTTLAGYGITDALATITPAGYIDGLKMVWNSGTSISVTSGAAYIQGSSAVIAFPSTLTLSSLSLAASTWYHLYGYLSAGTPAIELSTTAPAAAYSGTARSKTGDSSRRYVGSVLTDSSGNLWNFAHSGVSVMYDVNAAGTAPFRVLTNGTATTATNVSVAGCASMTAWQVLAKVDNTATNTAYIGVGRNGSGGSPFQGSIAPQTRGQWLIALNGATFGYVYNIAPTPSGGYVDVIGYEYER